MKELNKISIIQMQQIELNILKNFDEFCVKNNLRYYVAYGTLLGTIRHKGFIPWDDDIDIIMPREDYEKLLKYEKISENLTIYSRINHRDWPYAFAKCCDNTTVMVEETYKSGEIGVYIDIFPIDGVPVNNKLHLKEIDILHYCLITVQKNNLIGSTKFRTIIKKMIYPLANMIGMERLLDTIEKKAKKNLYKSSDLVAVQAINIYSGKEVIKKELIDSYIRMPFENIEVNVPIGYKTILRNLYGDYMQLPPEEKRVSHHFYDVRFKNDDSILG